VVAYWYRNYAIKNKLTLVFRGKFKALLDHVAAELVERELNDVV
jgi:hypothetical protein